VRAGSARKTGPHFFASCSNRYPATGKIEFFDFQDRRCRSQVAIAGTAFSSEVDTGSREENAFKQIASAGDGAPESA
jgi:hypothetical protein